MEFLRPGASPGAANLVSKGMLLNFAVIVIGIKSMMGNIRKYPPSQYILQVRGDGCLVGVLPQRPQFESGTCNISR